MNKFTNHVNGFFRSLFLLSYLTWQHIVRCTLYSAVQVLLSTFYRITNYGCYNFYFVYEATTYKTWKRRYKKMPPPPFPLYKQINFLAIFLPIKILFIFMFYGLRVRNKLFFF